MSAFACPNLRANMPPIGKVHENDLDLLGQYRDIPTHRAHSQSRQTARESLLKLSLPAACTATNTNAFHLQHAKNRNIKEQPPRLLPRWSLHPPHTRPPLTQWRCTRQGMPITLCIVSEWHPERCSHDERIKHVAYHMEHYIRRMPTKHGGTRRVHRCCFLMDMRGFKPSMVRAARPFDPFSTSRDLTHTRILTRGSLTDTAASPHQVGH